MFEPGALIQDYEIVKLLATGGYAEVYLVKSLRYQIDFVAKVLKMDYQNMDSIWDSFQREVGFLEKLDHPNIIRMYAHFRFKNCFILILEYCSNGSLEDLLRINGPLTLHHSYLKIVWHQILLALAFVHSFKIAHHDIKPSNILFDNFKRVKLIDFGISVLASEFDNRAGSIPYLAPEILLHQQSDPQKADIWALGVMLYQLATGNLPWAAKDTASLKKSICEAIVVYPTEMPREIVQLCMKMLQKNPNLRPTVSQLLEISQSGNSSLFNSISRSSISVASHGFLKKEISGYTSTNLLKRECTSHLVVSKCKSFYQHLLTNVHSTFI